MAPSYRYDVYDLEEIIDIVEDVTVNYDGCAEDPMDDPADYMVRDISVFRF